MSFLSRVLGYKTSGGGWVFWFICANMSGTLKEHGSPLTNPSLTFPQPISFNVGFFVQQITIAVDTLTLGLNIELGRRRRSQGIMWTRQCDVTAHVSQPLVLDCTHKNPVFTISYHFSPPERETSVSKGLLFTYTFSSWSSCRLPSVWLRSRTLLVTFFLCIFFNNKFIKLCKVF